METKKRKADGIVHTIAGKVSSPAGYSKKKDLLIHKLPFITEMDIWDCLRKNKWNKESNLTLFDIVNDIFTIKESELIEYLNSLK